MTPEQMDLTRSLAERWVETMGPRYQPVTSWRTIAVCVAEPEWAEGFYRLDPREGRRALAEEIARLSLLELEREAVAELVDRTIAELFERSWPEGGVK